jgi:hypothetical protein
MAYLDRVGDAMAAFEARLWGHVRGYRCVGEGARL